jgi:hypothetical protein
MQAKLEALNGVVRGGVLVTRSGPDERNTYTWRVTFVDNKTGQDLDYSVSVYSSNLKSKSSSSGVRVSKLKTGLIHPACDGAHVVPSTGGLVTGTQYYARAIAMNSVGYGPAQAAFSPEAPKVVPGRPTSAALTVASSTSLAIVFNPPTNDGGDIIVAYRLEWSTSPTFSNAGSVRITYLAGGAPYYKTITGLETGVGYYVRVSAQNSQGYGEAAISMPAVQAPMEEPGAPSGVLLRVTSDTMLTVSFDKPVYNGGNDVMYYTVEWDTSQKMNSLSAYPDRGALRISAQNHTSATLTSLTPKKAYYVQVSATNAFGTGKVRAATPSSKIPKKQVPGKPRALKAAADSSSGALLVSWSRPRVPHHGIPCSSTVGSPGDCPTAVGGVLSESTGGCKIREYEVEYNERSDFTGQDGGRQVTDGTSLVLVGLEAGAAYYVRVLARNSVGSSQFCGLSGENCNGGSVFANAGA